MRYYHCFSHNLDLSLRQQKSYLLELEVPNTFYFSLEKYLICSLLLSFEISSFYFTF